MKIELMRRLDHWLGPLLAFLVWLASLLFRRRLPLEAGEKVRDVHRILVIKIFGMGSILLATPAFRALARAYPGSRLEIVTAAGHRDFIDRLGTFEVVHGISLDSPRAFLAGVWRLLRCPRPDISINLEYYTWFTLILQTLQRARVRVGFAERQWLRLRLLDVPVYFNYHRHIRRIFSAVAENLGAEVSERKLVVPSFSAAEAEKISFLPGRSSSDRRLLAVHIGASPLSRLRQWPLARYGELLRGILAEFDATIALIGGPDEKGEADEFRRTLPADERVLNLVGSLSVGETLALLSRAAVLITNDSGPLHWAVALGIPTVSFFGPETPDLYGPPTTSRHRVFYSGRYCSPCMTTMYGKKSDCSDNLCLQDISVKEVQEALRELLAKEKTR